MKNIPAFLLAIFFFLPTNYVFGAPYTVHIEWEYTPPVSMEVMGYNIYFNNEQACYIDGATQKSFDCVVDAVSGEATVAVSAVFSDDTESNLSSSYSVTIPDDIQAVINTNILSGIAPLVVQFDASTSESREGDIVSYEWTVENEKNNKTAFEYTFTSAGNYVVKLIVTDSVGNTAEATCVINVSESGSASLENQFINFQPVDADVPGNAIPDNGLSYSDKMGFGWTKFPPSASATRDRDNPVSADQKYDTMIHVSPSAEWELALPEGTYDVTVCVGDASWASGTQAVQIEGVPIIAGEVLSNNTKWIEKTKEVSVQDGKLTLTFLGSDPLARLCWVSITNHASQDIVPVLFVSVTSGKAPLPVTFDGSGSTGDIVSYDWAFGDGQVATGSMVDHTFTAAGVYKTILTITDSQGNLAKKETIISVDEPVIPTNQPPHVVLSSSAAVGPGPLTVSFDGSGSSDDDGSISEWLWDFGDGTSGEGAKISHTYTQAGTYSAKLKVTDNLGESSEASTPVMVTFSAPENNKPTAVILLPTQKYILPTTVVFNGSKSTDSDGSIVKYEWNFGDGTTGSGAVISHTFTALADYVVTLKVIDNYGASASCTMQISVIEGSAPAFQYEAAEITIDDRWHLITFSQPFVNPVVVAAPLGYNDSDPAVVRIRNVQQESFEIRIEEWGYQDGGHLFEQVSYLVVEQGHHVFADGTVAEAGIFQGKSQLASHQFRSSFDQLPVVLTSVTSMNEEEAVVGRLMEVSDRGFDYILQEQEESDGEHQEEIVHYIAWKQGKSTVLSGGIVEAGIMQDSVDHTWHTLAYSVDTGSKPHLLASMQTFNSADTANLRFKNLMTGSVELQINEEQSRDSETDHTGESIGYLLLHPEAGGTISTVEKNINFQPEDVEIPHGYLVDSGLIYNETVGYGWKISPASWGTRDRNSSNAPGQAYDTMIHVSQDSVWEMDVPNGIYDVTVCVGDASWPSGTPEVQVEGTVAITGSQLSNSLKWIEKTVEVDVKDGKLTMMFAGSDPFARLCWLKLKSKTLDKPTPEAGDMQTHLAFNFQPENVETPNGYLKDSGWEFDQVQGYGWKILPANWGARDRNNPASQSQAYDTMIHVSPTAVWETELPDGLYNVTVCVGDASWPSGIPAVQVEGVNLMGGDALSQTTKWITKTQQVAVKDGKLTVTFNNSDPITRLCWLTIDSLQ